MIQRRTAHGWLAEAARLIDERGKQRDRPDGERSMPLATPIFEAITGKAMTPADGWLFMLSVKLARLRVKIDEDSIADAMAFFALWAEEVTGDGVPADAAPEPEPRFYAGQRVRWQGRRGFENVALDEWCAPNGCWRLIGPDGEASLAPEAELVPA